jgi:hypothetical protein
MMNLKNTPTQENSGMENGQITTIRKRVILHRFAAAFRLFRIQKIIS